MWQNSNSNSNSHRLSQQSIQGPNGQKLGSDPHKNAESGRAEGDLRLRNTVCTGISFCDERAFRGRVLDLGVFAPNGGKEGSDSGSESKRDSELLPNCRGPRPPRCVRGAGLGHEASCPVEPGRVGSVPAQCLGVVLS